MLAEEIQHGLDRVTAEASKSINRGLSNDEFQGEVFKRIVSNYESGKFQFLNTDDISAIGKITEGLR